MFRASIAHMIQSVSMFLVITRKRFSTAIDKMISCMTFSQVLRSISNCCQSCEILILWVQESSQDSRLISVYEQIELTTLVLISPLYASFCSHVLTLKLCLIDQYGLPLALCGATLFVVISSLDFSSPITCPHITLKTSQIPCSMV